MQHYIDGILEGDRVVLAKAITLTESQLAADRELADLLIEKILPRTGNSIRIGITGVPGVGKSTFIEAFGSYIIQNHKKKVAVLTVDPTSKISKGSILGDKTRMEALSKNPMAFIRPSSSGEAIGGVTHGTREAMHLCEAAGFEVIILETVGVGQSETAVKNIVDFFLLLMLAGAGDELQGIKKGIIEMADALVITKADGNNLQKALEAQAEYQHALHLLRPDESGWTPRVLTSSAFNHEGIESTWQMLEEFVSNAKTAGYFEKRRQQHLVAWMHECFHELIQTEIINSRSLTGLTKELESDVLNKKKNPQKAAQELMQEFARVIKIHKDK